MTRVSEIDRLVAAWPDDQVLRYVRVKLWHLWNIHGSEERDELRAEANLTLLSMIAAGRITREHAAAIVRQSKEARNQCPPS